MSSTEAHEPKVSTETKPAETTEVLLSFARHWSSWPRVLMPLVPAVMLLVFVR